jgi:hypothetical protein
MSTPREWPIGSYEACGAAPLGTQVRNTLGHVATKTTDLLWEWAPEGGRVAVLSCNHPPLDAVVIRWGKHEEVLKTILEILEDHPGNHMQVVGGPPTDHRVRHAYLEAKAALEGAA